MNNRTEIISERKRPELPSALGRYKLLYSFLKEAPYGPEYVGMRIFAVDMLPKAWINYIKEEQANYSCIEMCKHLALQYNITARAEAIANHYHHGNEVRFWNVSKSQYVKTFEKTYVSAQQKRTMDRYQSLYKPFIIWLIEQGYEYSQVAVLLGRAPSTIRMWANDWGYKEHSRIVTRMPDYTGKVRRVDHGDGIENDPNVVVDHTTHSIKVYHPFDETNEAPSWKRLRKEISLIWKHFVSLVLNH
jgi:hypothetical protein